MISSLNYFFFKKTIFYFLFIQDNISEKFYIYKKRKDMNLWKKTNFHCVWKVIVIKKVIADKNLMAKVVAAFFSKANFSFHLDCISFDMKTTKNTNILVYLRFVCGDLWAQVTFIWMRDEYSIYLLFNFNKRTLLHKIHHTLFILILFYFFYVNRLKNFVWCHHLFE